MKSRGRAKSVPVFLCIFKIIGNFNEKAIKIFLILKKTAKSIIIYYICIFRDFGGCFMLHTSILKLQAVTSELSMSEKFVSSAKVILTGFAVVFAMLFLLILIIKLYSAIIAGAQNAADKKKKKQKVVEAVSGDGGIHIIQKPAYITPPTIEEGIPEEVVAVIAAAVAASGMSSSKTRIKSIKKASGGRSAWANAGVLDNTRPF